jgi:FkbM family methyltransferase
MDILRSIKKAFLNPRLAGNKIKAISQAYFHRLRLHYGYLNILGYEIEPISYIMPTGGKLLLEPGHFFTRKLLEQDAIFEPETVAFLKSILKTGDTFIDCGANIGYYSIIAGDLVGPTGRVVGIEANPITYKFLTRNLEANNLPPGINCALSNKTGKLILYAPARSDVLSSLHKNKLFDNDNVREFSVDARTLDEIVTEINLSKIDLIKIDVEGGELDILKSSTHIFAKFRPIFIVEYSPTTWSVFDASKDLLEHIVVTNNYVIREFSLEDNRLISIENDVWERSSYTNLLLLPKESPII